MIEKKVRNSILTNAVNWLQIMLDFFTMVEENFEIQSFQNALNWL